MRNIKLFSLIVIFIMMFSFGTMVYGEDLNGIGAETTEETVAPTNEESTSQPVSKEDKTTRTANAVGEMISNTGIDEEAINQANAFIRPFASILNKVMAGILGITSLLMMFVTVLDLAYIALPFVRDILDGGMQGSNQMMQGGRGGMGGRYAGRYGGMGGMGGYGGMSGGYGGMGGYGGGMNQQQQNIGGGLSAIGRWVSDEAIAATLDAQGGPMGASSANGSIKTMILSYMKKRAFFLIMFGICVILFTSTVFTDLGIKLGTWLLGLLMGVVI